MSDGKEQLRVQALVLAIDFYRPQGPTSPGLIVETAKGFLMFLNGERFLVEGRDPT